MKKKAILVVLLGVMGLAALSIGNAEAAPPWYTCTISQVGANWDAYYVTLKDTTTPTPLFGDTTFYIGQGYGTKVENAMYAAALSAWANSTYVTVYLPSTTAGSPVFAIYATK